MDPTIEHAGLRIDASLYRFVTEEVAPGTGVEPEHFWKSLADILEELIPRNRALLERRDDLQQQIDGWNRERKGGNFDVEEQKRFLAEIGYVVPEGSEFRVHVDKVEIGRAHV